jgi:ABC-type uncharacterized transport system ATPase subunit
MTPTELEIEKWIARAQGGVDAICHKLREIARTESHPDVLRQKVMNTLLVHQIETAHRVAELMSGIGVSVPPVLGFDDPPG